MSVEIYNGQSKSPLLLLAAGGNSGIESAVAMAFGEGEGRRCLCWRDEANKASPPHRDGMRIKNETCCVLFSFL
jgi:hypothetical protein